MLFGRKWYVLIMLSIILALFLAGCATNQSIAQQQAIKNAADREYYVPKNDVEGRNYDWRLQISDDPSMIVWCTMFPPTPGVKPVTVPVIGKLTSGGKRPFLNEPDAQGMYGSSGDYRYGFGPSGKNEYYDFYSLPTFCTTTPMVWQAQLTVVVQDKDQILSAASKAAHDALVRGDSKAATDILTQAIKSVGGQ